MQMDSTEQLDKSQVFSIVKLNKTLLSGKEAIFQLERNHQAEKRRKKKVKKMLEKMRSQVNRSNSAFNEGRWNSDEHANFVQNLLIYKNNWKKLQEIIKTRNSTQIRSHAQKYIIKLCRKYSVRLSTKRLKCFADGKCTMIKNQKLRSIANMDETDRKVLDIFIHPKKNFLVDSQMLKTPNTVAKKRPILRRIKKIHKKKVFIIEKKRGDDDVFYANCLRKMIEYNDKLIYSLLSSHKLETDKILMETWSSGLDDEYKGFFYLGFIEKMEILLNKWNLNSHASLDM